MSEVDRSPPITHLSWGHLEVDGRRFKDAKVFPGGVREWDWRETGTRHRPGIQPADVTELLDHGATTLVLSSGFLRRLQVCPETLHLLDRRGVTVGRRRDNRRLNGQGRLSRTPGRRGRLTCRARDQQGGREQDDRSWEGGGRCHHQMMWRAVPGRQSIASKTPSPPSGRGGRRFRSGRALLGDPRPARAVVDGL